MNFNRLICYKYSSSPPYLRFTWCQIRPFTPMASAGQPAATEPAASKVPKGKKELKILMLHGYTQSGTLFSAKTKALSKLLTKGLSAAPLNLHPTLIYPTGPHRLRPSDVPGYKAPEDSSEALDEDDLDNWAWWRKDEATGKYRGFEAGMSCIASAIREAGGVDGVMGFSQGGCMAALVASALEQPHHNPPNSDPNSNSGTDYTWLRDLRQANNNRPLSFCVIYSGFYAPPTAGLDWLYEPQIATPTLHFLGSNDQIVTEDRSMALVERCRDPLVLTHPGTHFVPVARDWAMPVVGWLRERCVKEAEKEEKP